MSASAVITPASPARSSVGAPSAQPSPRTPLRVLMVTSDYPVDGKPRTTHFIKRQAEFLRAAGVDVEVFPFDGSKRFLNYVRAWRKLQRHLRSRRYDLIHAQFGQSGILTFPKRLPLVVTLRGSDILGIVDDASGRYTRKGRILQALSRLVARRADAVILVSNHMRAVVGRTDSVHVIPSGLDLELFRPLPRQEARERLGLSPIKRLVLFVGRPNQARKRYELARKAVDVLNDTLPAELVVAWKVQHADVPYYMAACDVMVFTSMQEGSPNVVKEALACNLPVVSVPVGDVETRLAGIEGCEVCHDESPEAIAAALERALRRGGRINGRATVEHLDETLLTQKVIAIYEGAARPRAGSGRRST